MPQQGFATTHDYDTCGERCERPTMTPTIFFLIKFYEDQEHANDFLRGQVFLNRLSRFKRTEGGDQSGRSDRHEGTTAWLQPGKGRLVLNGIDISGDLAGPVCVQKEWLNHLHVFSMHAVHTGDLDLEPIGDDNIETLRRQLRIPDPCRSLGHQAIVVTSVTDFINRMRSVALEKRYGISRGLVGYYDPQTFHGNFEDTASVFHKQERFSYQREFRFAVHTQKAGESPLKMHIGDLSDIAVQMRSSDLNGEKFLGGDVRFELV